MEAIVPVDLRLFHGSREDLDISIVGLTVNGEWSAILAAMSKRIVGPATSLR